MVDDREHPGSDERAEIALGQIDHVLDDRRRRRRHVVAVVPRKIDEREKIQGRLDLGGPESMPELVATCHTSVVSRVDHDPHLGAAHRALFVPLRPARASATGRAIR